MRAAVGPDRKALPVSGVSRKINRFEVVFDEGSLVADAGLVAATLAGPPGRTRGRRRTAPDRAGWPGPGAYSTAARVSVRPSARPTLWASPMTERLRSLMRASVRAAE